MDRLCVFILTTFCGAFVGMYFSRRLQDRYYFLTEFSAIVLRIEGLIKYNRYAVSEVLSKIQDGKLEFITDEMIETAKSGKRIDELWKKEVQRIKYLTYDDKRVVSEFGESLGKSSTEGQIAVLQSVRSNLDVLIKDSDEIRKSKVKLYRTLGILLGAAVGIVFL
ncbi:MAG: hypothetical protein E7490_01835 [Ruminococcaceae bacterium]|nr:hypothetical protein [Oscillospiraceae bacterium]